MAHDRPLRSVSRDLVIKYFWRQLSIEFSSEVRRFNFQPRAGVHGVPLHEHMRLASASNARKAFPIR